MEWRIKETKGAEARTGEKEEERTVEEKRRKVEEMRGEKRIGEEKRRRVEEMR